MELEKVFTFLGVFVFVAFLFPTLNNACMEATGDLAPLIKAFPFVFLIVAATFPIYFAIKKSR